MRSQLATAPAGHSVEERERLPRATMRPTPGGSIDPSGRLAWESNDIDGDHVVAILSERVADKYLAFLRERAVSSLLAGARDVDLSLAPERIGASNDAGWTTRHRLAAARLRREPLMTSPEMWKAPDIVPTVTYADLPRAVEWLQRVFGFRERTDARLTWPGGGMTWMEVGNALFALSLPDPTWPSPPRDGPPDVVMKVYVDDLDAHFDRAKAEGARIVSEPEDGFWGGRIYRALDHEGHRWELSQRGRDLAAERWRLPPGVTRGIPGSRSGRDG